MVIVYTGDGKGKTTAAVGLAVRAAGHGKKVIVIQFIKSPHRPYGEAKILQQLGIAVHQTGVGFTWTKTPEQHREALQKGWALAKKCMLSGEYDIAILDELNVALAITSFPIDDVLPLQDVVHTLTNKPAHTHVVVTGRGAKEEIIELADLVTEMKEVKHYYHKGVHAIKGIDL
ncbi:cob(I)yrinic acid a,c-diamide adenosyltransferase [Anoxybacillus flavithermus]|uniref:Cob(I)yrinic acid a,c-diamide adenosyltransferase n=1 Tax=Anoxybacillus flavithermus TaxID=33934 RepID=A0A2G5RT28_9BACL|nr:MULTISPECIES: cob(I)yrinic acid a,c-diamide adenosyltransferase [Anoxybacillus]KFZ43814.1 cobinamide adenolsyltransferase [Anoxybacillus sp. KU2-6(11)]PIC05880.1 cob(I)yrinic acid a,c-diamide adenosyltransferase [Anoxybacillus flavithermus]